MKDSNVPPVVGDSWGCREVGVNGHEAFESFVDFRVRNTAIEYDA
jgi:hypothetical protein